MSPVSLVTDAIDLLVVVTFRQGTSARASDKAAGDGSGFAQMHPAHSGGPQYLHNILSSSDLYFMKSMFRDEYSPRLHDTRDLDHVEL